MDVQFVKLAALVQFRGTNYAGFQRQANGIAVQNVLEEAISKVNARRTVVLSSGRTDAGVHAWAMPIAFWGRGDLSPERWTHVLNASLPPDVRVLEIVQSAPDFHPQKSAYAKLYAYYASFAKPSPLCYDLTAYFHRPPHLVEQMRDAAALLVGAHDFSGFSKSGSSVRTTRRTIYDVRLSLSGDRALFTFLGDGFLYGQVRLMVGTLLEIGWGLKDADQVQKVLRGEARATYLAPACGLHLVKVWMDPDPFTEGRN
ncbi:tRNA pseudouridine(38-40) synthase TruA [Coprothermobacteraceae bacterium]|nr:tRNA pseudouridine(38-40) synthase TruA [Coprothermobacteraceae bacterium]